MAQSGESQMKRSVNSRGSVEIKRTCPEIDAETAKIVRTVRDNEAFYFFEAIGKPTGDVARNLCDFLNKVKTVRSESLLFHVQRKDFGNWVAKTLGDARLAEKLDRIPSSNSAELRINVCRTVGNRIKELSESTTTTLNEDNHLLARA